MYPAVSIRFRVTDAEDTISWFYTGFKPPKTAEAALSIYDCHVRPDQIVGTAIKMLFKSSDIMRRVLIYSAYGVMSITPESKLIIGDE